MKPSVEAAASVALSGLQQQAVKVWKALPPEGRGWQDWNVRVTRRKWLSH